MNILLETGLPEEIDGYPIFPDFRNMIRFELVLQDKILPDHLKIRTGLNQLFETVPPDKEYAFEKLLWFYGCGHQSTDEEKSKADFCVNARAYDFEKDSELIYSGFYSAYGISLTTVEFMHWWEFMALLQALPDTTAMGRVMYFRTVDLNKISDKDQRKFLHEQKQRWKLEPLMPETRKSLAEIENSMKEKIRRLNENAKEQMNKISKKGD